MHLGLRRSATFQPQLFAHLLLLFITYCFGNLQTVPLSPSKRFLSTSRLLLNDHHHHNCSTSADCASEELQNEGNHQHFNRHCIAGKCRCPFGFISHHFGTSHNVNARKNQGLYFCHPYRCYHNFECQREFDRWTRCALERHQCICLPEAAFNSTTQSCEVAGMMKMKMLMRMTKINDENNNVSTFSQLLSTDKSYFFMRKTSTKKQQKSHWWLLVLTVPLALLTLLYLGHKAFQMIVRRFGGGRISNTTANSSSITTNINGSAASSASRFYATFHRCSATSASNELP